MKLYVAEAGHTVVRLHQSDLNEYMLCPERARLLWTGQVTSGPSDATAIGTAVHAGAEALLRGADCYKTAREVMLATLEQEVSDPSFRWVQVKTWRTLVEHAERALHNWATLVEPHLGPPVFVEHSFDLHLCWYADDVEIRLGGQVDLGEETGIWDWKTTRNRAKYLARWPGEGWKLRRWAIQPTAYCWAVEQLDLLPNPRSFTYAAVSKTTEEAWFLPVERSESDYAWLQEVARNAVTMLRADLPEWPKLDQHALCSEDWCPAWALCKGRNGSVKPRT